MLQLLKKLRRFLEQSASKPDGYEKDNAAGGLPLWICAGDIAGVGVNCERNRNEGQAALSDSTELDHPTREETTS